MTFSPLISGTLPHHDKYASRQGNAISRVLQHHHAASSNAGVDRLTNPTQPASSNYIIMSTGEILGQVPEEYRAWTSGSFEADAPSITIEVQNSGGQVNGNDSDPASWPITNAAYNSIVNLVADVAKRYGWGGVTEGNYRGHREFSQTACPGGYIWARMSKIRAAANNAYAIGGGITTQGTTVIEKGFPMALTDKQQEDIYWFLCAPDGREYLAELVGGRAADKTLNTPIKRYGSGLGGESSLAAFVAWNDTHVEAIVNAVSAVAPTADLEAIKAAVHEGLAEGVKVNATVTIEGGK